MISCPRATMKAIGTVASVGLLLLPIMLCSAESFDGRWGGLLIPNERCKDGTIEFEIKDNRLTSGFIQGSAPNGRVNKGSISGVEPVESNGKMKIMIGNKSPGSIAFTGKTFDASFSTQNCAERQARGERKE
jgi:hypothetical protein